MSDVAEVTVGCLSYRVRYGSLAALGDAHGVADHDARTVWLSPSLPPAHMLAILIHEIIHVGLLAYGHHVPGTQTPDFCEERMASVAGVILSEALVRSPSLLDAVKKLVAGETP